MTCAWILHKSKLNTLWVGFSFVFRSRVIVATQHYAGDSRKRCQLLVPASSEVTLGGGLIDLANIVGIMKTPDGSSEHCLLKKMPDGQLGKSRFC